MTDATDPQAPNPIELRNVTFGYPPHGDRRPVLIDINLTVPPRDFLGVIGPNGGGKTTLLKLILGWHKPQNGCVTVFGGESCRARRRIGYVPQHATIDRTVPANVLDVVLTGLLAQSPAGVKYPSRCIEQARSTMKQTGIDDLAHRPVNTLSGGQLQRVLIARAIVGSAELLLLDEPTAGVDVHMEKSLIDLLIELNHKMTIVMVSHDIAFVSANIKRVACLNRTLTCHAAREVSEQTVANIYHDHVHAVTHDDNCPHSNI